MHATGTLMRLEVTPHSSRAHKHTAVSGPLTASRRHQHSRAHHSWGGGRRDSTKTGGQMHLIHLSDTQKTEYANDRLICK